MPRTTIATLVLILATGCGGPEVTKVTGQVLLDGEPFNKGCVCFWPAHDLTLGVFTAYGCEEDGSFAITPDPEQGQGRAGAYLVLITDRGISIRSKIHPKYKDKNTTPFQIDILAGETNDLLFDIEPNPHANKPLRLPKELNLD